MLSFLGTSTAESQFFLCRPDNVDAVIESQNKQKYMIWVRCRFCAFGSDDDDAYDNDDDNSLSFSAAFRAELQPLRADPTT